jgi:DNA polymerase-3 subunit delta
MAQDPLDQALQAGLKPVFVVLGDEALLVKQAEERLTAKAIEGVMAAFNLSVARAGEESAAEALSVARTLPMMSARRVVILRDVHEASPALIDALLRYLENPSPSTVLGVFGTGFAKAGDGKDPLKRVEALLKKDGVLVRYRAKDQDPVAFAIETARGLGCSLDRREATLLVELVGKDLGQLRLEIEKACMYLGGQGRLDEAVLGEVCSLLAEAQIWDLTDAVVARDADHALATCLRLMDAKKGGESHRLMAMISWQLRQLLSLQHAMRTGGGDAVKMAPWKREKAERALRESPIGTAEVLARLADTNQDMNSHRAGDRRVFEGLLLRLLARRANHI